MQNLYKTIAFCQATNCHGSCSWSWSWSWSPSWKRNCILCYVLYVTLERWPCSRYPIELCRQTDLAIIVGMAEGTHCTPSLSTSPLLPSSSTRLECEVIKDIYRSVEETRKLSCARIHMQSGRSSWPNGKWHTLCWPTCFWQNSELQVTTLNWVDPQLLLLHFT